MHDNTRPHKIKLVREKLDCMKVVKLVHPPYSQNMAPCDFWPFLKQIKDLSEKEFDSR